MSLTTTPCHPDADSYISLTEANSYVTNNKQDTGAWGSATDPQKELSLRQATKLIDKYRFHYRKLTRPQRLKFPRNDSQQLSGQGGVTSTLITDTTNLQKKEEYPENFWKYGAVQIRTESSTAWLELKEISASSFANGTVTCAALTTPGASDEWLLIEKVPDEIRYATVEIAMWVLDGKLVNSSNAGVKSESIGHYSVSYADGASFDFIDMPEQARDYLSPYIKITGNIL